MTSATNISKAPPPAAIPMIAIIERALGCGGLVEGRDVVALVDTAEVVCVGVCVTERVCMCVCLYTDMVNHCLKSIC